MELLELYLSPLENDPLAALLPLQLSSLDEKTCPKFKIIVTQSPAGEIETESSLPFIDDEGKDWRSTIIRTLELSSFSPKDFSIEEQDWMVEKAILASDRLTFHHDYLVNIGRGLYQSLFPQGSIVEQLLQESIRFAEYKSSKLLVRLKFQEDVVGRLRLPDYPWELAYGGYFLCHRQVEFSRYIADRTVPPNSPAIEKLNVLLVSSSAFDEDIGLKKFLSEERTAIFEGLKAASDRGDIFLEELEKPTFARLRKYLTERTPGERPNVLHFDGHGLFGKQCSNPKCRAMNKGTKLQECQKCKMRLWGQPQGYLVFEDESGNPDYVSAETLGTLLLQSGFSDGSNQVGGVALAVLSACQSGMAIAGDSVFNGAGQNLISHRVPAVVAMQYSVKVDSASKFVEQFYRSLGQKQSLALAIGKGREAMDVKGNQWYRPVLYLRWKDNDGGQLFASPKQWYGIPRIQDVNVLRGKVGSGYAIEILVENPSNKDICIHKVTLGSMIPCDVKYMGVPPSYYYEVNLEVNPSLKTATEFSIEGFVKDLNDPFPDQRSVSGVIAVNPYDTYFEISFPMYLIIDAKAWQVIRLPFRKPRTRLKDWRFYKIGRRLAHPDRQETDIVSRWCYRIKHYNLLQNLKGVYNDNFRNSNIGHWRPSVNDSWIVLEGSMEQPMRCKWHGYLILQIFKGLGIQELERRIEHLEWCLKNRLLR